MIIKGGEMRQFIVVRVGEYSTKEKTLTDRGRATIRLLAQELKRRVGELTVVLMSSDATRALASAAIIGEVLGVKVEAHCEFFSDELHEPNLRGGRKLVEVYEKCTDIVILVTHYDFVGRFPAYFASKRGFAVRSWPVEKATALMVDCGTHELVHIRGL